jgi:hypothetical protein
MLCNNATLRAAAAVAALVAGWGGLGNNRGGGNRNQGSFSQGLPAGQGNQSWGGLGGLGGLGGSGNGQGSGGLGGLGRPNNRNDDHRDTPDTSAVPAVNNQIPGRGGWGGRGNQGLGGLGQGGGTGGLGGLGGLGGGGGAVPTQGGFGGQGTRGRPSLSPLIGDTAQYGRISSRPLALSGQAGTLAQGLGRRGNTAAAAQGLAQAVDRGQGDAAAQAVAGAAASGADSVAIGEAVAEATRRQPRVAPYVLRRSADLAVNSGHTQGFARSMSNAFVYAQRNRWVPTVAAAAAAAVRVYAFPVFNGISPSSAPAATVAS